MKKYSWLAAWGFAMLLASSCATIDRIASEQEEEMRGATTAALSSGVNSRWEVGNWDFDYASE